MSKKGKKQSCHFFRYETEGMQEDLQTLHKT